MPSGFSALDTSFPDLEGKDTEESIEIVTDYLYQLLEQLRYMLHNLGTNNFNRAELEAFASSISTPIGIALQEEIDRATGAEGTLRTDIEIQAGRITSEVSRATEAEGTLSSRITQNADAITAEVARATGAESAVQQTADAIKAQVTDGQGNYTVLNLKSDGLHIGNASGTTTINGGSITAKTIGAQQIAAGSITANEIAAGTITAAEIAANTITGNKIAANVALSAPVIVGGSITSAEIYGGGYHDIDGDATLDITSFSGFTALLYGPAGMQSIADSAMGVYAFANNHVGHFYIGGTQILEAGGNMAATLGMNFWQFKTHGIGVPYGSSDPDSSTPGYGTLGALYFKI